MTFCSNKIDDLSLKLEYMVSNVKQNTNKIYEIENKFIMMQKEIDCLKYIYNIAEQFKLFNNLDLMSLPKPKKANVPYNRYNHILHENYPCLISFITFLTLILCI